ncbi:flagellin [uncultured Roseobacter sp.]|uniref:flagellin N-terminal helical domain-containing protein n=1 Tax=uncultured Roseobacter sp. TaxID=114847 RepID=UPI002613F4A5|nr:flagellin [uncultured Roseobacter sp.]
MSSILTNNSAMVALQTLKATNAELGKVQGEISTGLTVESAKDNAATWAISKVMSSDVAGFEAISDSLALGQSTVGVALSAAESITDLLTEIKGKIVNAQEENVDRGKIQTDIEALTSQISSIAGAAQFNGLNLLTNDGYDAGSGTSNILSSLDRSSTGVAASMIDVVKQDLSTSQGVYSTAGTAVEVPAMISSTGAPGTSVPAYTVVTTDITDKAMFSINGLETFTLDPDERIIVSTVDGDTVNSLQDKLITALNFVSDTLGNEITFFADPAVAGQILASNDKDVANAIAATNMNKILGATDDGTTSIGGGLSLLNQVDVTSQAGAAAALGAIESLIQTSIDASAALGSAGKRIETQAEFVSALTDNLKSGIGALVDANMEVASARLQALETQQQLAVQALSIANQAPQTILSLFR